MSTTKMIAKHLQNPEITTKVSDEFAANIGQQVVRLLASRYGFDEETAMNFLLCDPKLKIISSEPFAKTMMNNTNENTRPTMIVTNDMDSCAAAEPEQALNGVSKEVPKGFNCHVEGIEYEKIIHNIVKKCTIDGKKFNTQNEDDLAGCTSKNDLECNFKQNNDIGIECRKCNTPDWMQCSLHYDKNTNSWDVTKKGKIPLESRTVFSELIKGNTIYHEVPPFMINKITHEEWVKTKSNTDKWNDQYVNIPSDTIAKLYTAKGCKYIQISEYGLYHLGDDLCGFGVPLFDIEQQIRIRTKIHTRKNKQGFCVLSVIAACQPKNIKQLIPSKYSLDDKDKLPPGLLWQCDDYDL